MCFKKYFKRLPMDFKILKNFFYEIIVVLVQTTNIIGNITIIIFLTELIFINLLLTLVIYSGVSEFCVLRKTNFPLFINLNVPPT